jgi:hypothetical protein
LAVRASGVNRAIGFESRSVRTSYSCRSCP